MFAGDSYARAAVFIGVIAAVIAVTVIGIFVTVRVTRRKASLPVARVIDQTARGGASPRGSIQ